MKILTVTILTLLVGLSAQATPGDMGCTGKLGKDKVDVLIGYDNYGEGASLLEISVGGRILMSATTVDEKIVNVGTEDAPSLKSAISGIDEADSVADMYFLDRESRAQSLDAVLSFAITDGISASKIKITCER